jgi:2'-5' RNA ligase
MAMLAIPVHQNISRLLQEIDLDIDRDSSNHISMFYLGDNIPMSRILKIIPVLYDIIQDTKPFTVEVSSYTHFQEGKHGYPIICPVKSKELQNLHYKIKKEFNKNNIKFDTTFKEYNPHITLGYSPDIIKNQKFQKIEFAITEISLYGGDESDTRLFVNFPFSIIKKAKLNEFSDIYCKYTL